MTVAARACPRSARQLLDEAFYDARSGILEIAALLDRLDRAGDETGGDPRRDALDAAVGVLASNRYPRVDAILASMGDSGAGRRAAPRRNTQAEPAVARAQEVR